MEILYGLMFLLIVGGGGLILWTLLCKAARGVPTAGNIARAQLRTQDARQRTDAQNAAADEIIAQAAYRDQGARIAPATVTPHTTDEVEKHFTGRIHPDAGH